MKRRQFLKSSAVIAGSASLGLPGLGRAQAMPEVVQVGHLVGICMSPLFYAHATGLFQAEGLNKVELKFMPNPGDALTALTGGAQHIVHIPFTNTIVAANNGAPVRIIGGSGAGGLFLIAQGSTGIKSMDDLKKARGKNLKIGAMRLNTFELMLYRVLANAGLKYDDFDMVWFNDVLSMAAAFEAKAVNLVTHVEPFATRMVDKMGGVPIASNLDVWGRDGPDCVTNARSDFIEKYPDATRRYLRALLKADAAIKADREKAVDILDKGKYYRVDRDTLRAALPRQMPQVDLTRGGEDGMRIAIKDMTTLGYIKQVPATLIDLRFLREAMKA
jgi:ABC-type nitrate/sulfonate/bicarbonate transport system substrate-binding protein